MKLFILAITMLFAVTLASRAAESCTHDLEVLCIDDINKGIQLANVSLPSVRPSREGEGKGRPRGPGVHEVSRHHRQGMLAMHLRRRYC